jgi:hypothetical protein
MIFGDPSSFRSIPKLQRLRDAVCLFHYEGTRADYFCILHPVSSQDTSTALAGIIVAGPSKA